MSFNLRCDIVLIFGYGMGSEILEDSTLFPTMMSFSQYEGSEFMCILIIYLGIKEVYRHIGTTVRCPWLHFVTSL